MFNSKKSNFKITIIFLFLFTVILGLSNNLNAKELQSAKIGVNKFAWYAALQTVNFMPLISADPFSGVVITDWYSVTNKERFKIVVYILEGGLSSQTVAVKLFKQVKVSSTWEDVTVSQNMISQIEDSILNTARELKINNSIGAK